MPARCGHTGGYDHDNKRFVDLDGNQIRFLFKLYPWEYMLTDEFAPNLPTTDIALSEPPWNDLSHVVFAGYLFCKHDALS
ncbi:MAG TPA: hypothetical protein DCZ04_13860 [Syntrophorhabdus aromaticivorans]|nr:hypothetical protein [Syntrophorhabdus aromaticivorans]